MQESKVVRKGKKATKRIIKERTNEITSQLLFINHSTKCLCLCVSKNRTRPDGGRHTNWRLIYGPHLHHRQTEWEIIEEQ